MMMMMMSKLSDFRSCPNGNAHDDLAVDEYDDAARTDQIGKYFATDPQNSREKVTNNRKTTLLLELLYMPK